MRYIEHRTQTDHSFAIERLRSAEAHLDAARQREATLTVALAQAQAERDSLREREAALAAGVRERIESMTPVFATAAAFAKVYERCSDHALRDGWMQVAIGLGEAIRDLQNLLPPQQQTEQAAQVEVAGPISRRQGYRLVVWQQGARYPVFVRKG